MIDSQYDIGVTNDNIYWRYHESLCGLATVSIQSAFPIINNIIIYIVTSDRTSLPIFK